MTKQFVCFLVAVSLVLPAYFCSCAHARPSRPGPNFVWVETHTVAGGAVIHGHWRYDGPRKKDKVWVPGHYGPKGGWVAGQWRQLTPPRSDAHWVPGHHGPRGRWIPGYWR